MGFLIKDEWHGAYDRYEWSWYFKVSAHSRVAIWSLIIPVLILVGNRMAFTTHTSSPQRIP